MKGYEKIIAQNAKKSKECRSMQNQMTEEKRKEMLDEFLSALPSDIKRFLIQEKKTNKVA